MIAWLALVLALLELALIVAVVLFAVFTWKRVAPTVAPLLGILAPPPAPAGNPWPAAPPSSTRAPELENR